MTAVLRFSRLRFQAAPPCEYSTRYFNRTGDAEQLMNSIIESPQAVICWNQQFNLTASGGVKQMSQRVSCTLLAFLAVSCSLFVGTARADHKAATIAAKEKNWGLVLKECKADAEAGEPNCQSHLGTLYKFGRGVERNLSLSVEYFRKCADQGQVTCLESLGDSYRNGLGVPRDYAEAMRLFRLSAAKGNSWAFNNIGNLYAGGLGVPMDAAEAARNYKIAADQGLGVAQANLANLYRIGQGVVKNGDMAFQLAQRAAKQNVGNGWNVLGLLYRDGVGVRQDSKEALLYFKKAVEPGVEWPATIAYANLASMYYRGVGVPVSYDEAAKWAEVGVRVGQPNSMLWLASVLAQGTKTIPADKRRAFELAQRALDAGLADAKGTLGWFHLEGIGTAVDPATAFKLLSESADQGSSAAAVRLGRMHLEGKGVPKDAARAHQYLMIGLARKNDLGPGLRRYVEEYFANQGTSGGQPKSTEPSRLAETKPQGNTRATPADEGQRQLLERLEKMQQQLEMLQSSANSINQNQVMERATQTAVRRALVIGNDSYQNVAPLINAREDASTIAQALTKLGYKVSLFRDLDEKRFKQSLREFRASLEGGEEILFFFAGHGVQLGSANYLLPVDVRGDNEEQVKDEAIDLQRVLDDMKSRSSKFALAIIDACRDNPFQKSGRALGGRGLAPTTAATGQMIMFSAGSGQQALDKLGPGDKERNGVFTRVLLKEMVKPGVPVDRVLRNVRNEVVRLSKSVGHEQTPALYDQAVGDFYFSLAR